MNDNPRVSPEEKLFFPGPESSGKKMMLPPKQKTVNCMIKVVWELCKSGRLVLATVWARLLLRGLFCDSVKIVALLGVIRIRGAL